MSQHIFQPHQEGLSTVKAYEMYPCIIPYAVKYEEMPYFCTPAHIGGFSRYVSQDKTRILLTCHLSRNDFNYLEFIINAEDNSLIWCGSRRIHQTMWIVNMCYSSQNIFIGIEIDADFDYARYTLIGMTKYPIEMYNISGLCLPGREKCVLSYIKFMWLKSRLSKMI